MSNAMQIVLAPMEGVVDAPMRRLQAAIGGPDAMVTEFVRVTEHLLPPKVFYRLVPELQSEYCGYGEVPLTVQLLGSNPQTLGQNAVRAIELGAPAIDLNFGCPAKTVNKSMGGAIMLRQPNSVFDAVKGVRSAVDPHYSVSGKMRLGYEDKSLALENAKAIEEGGAAYLTVHARTKVEGYKPPAHWEWIARIRESVNIPVVANGEIWTPEDYHKCREVSGCERIMIGRGLVANPFLVEQIRNPGANRDTEHNWQRLQPYLLNFFDDVKASIEERHVHGRIKQWLTMLGWHFPQAKELFQKVRTEREADGVERVLRENCRVEL
jgi:tRNA-dihydrouridine synthase C